MLPHLSLPVSPFKKLFFQISSLGARLLCLPPEAAEGVLLNLAIFHGVLDGDSACSQSVAWESCELGLSLSLPVCTVEKTIL